MAISKPKDEEAVFEVMQKYAQTKRYSFSEPQLRYHAEHCYLYYEGRGWQGCKYWPAWVMKWLLTQNKGVSKIQQPKPSNGKTVRDLILEQEHDV
jgi:hypothetical protein